jgi:hypothetical protein
VREKVDLDNVHYEETDGVISYLKILSGGAEEGRKGLANKKVIFPRFQR